MAISFTHRSRTKNMMLYGILGGKEFLSNSQRYLERRIQLECDGEPVSLPLRLQGLVFLNIPSYMAGTNFWGTEREKGVCTSASAVRGRVSGSISLGLLLFITIT